MDMPNHFFVGECSSPASVSTADEDAEEGAIIVKRGGQQKLREDVQCTQEQTKLRRGLAQATVGEREQAFKQCGTPGCELTDFHQGPCTSKLVVGPRQRRPSARATAGVAMPAPTCGPAKGERKKRAAPFSEETERGRGSEKQETEDVVDTCGTFGCTLQDRHLGLHAFQVAEGRPHRRNAALRVLKENYSATAHCPLPRPPRAGSPQAPG